MKKTVFIDGREGTTGLQIDERLAGRSDIELLTIDPEKRKDPAERKKYLNEADFVFLCLRWIMEKAREFQKNIYYCFIDYAKAFDCVAHSKLWKILQEMGISDQVV